ncbi:MAG: hypothetical protein CL926_01025 [Deltaproteobacteria bacterium]|nr:hypothetical protein [Deltaproteobacteria bacterium]
MRTAVCFTLLLLFTSLSAIAGVHASPPTEGSTVLISADETWNGTHAMNGNIVIENGAELTINGDVTIATGNSITVQENSTLTLSGSLIGEELDSGIAIMNNTQLHLNFGDLAESGQLRVDFDQTIPNSAMFNMTVGEETIDAVGSDHIFIDVSLNGTDLLADFYVYYAFEIQIVSIQALHSGSGESPLLLANEINQTNGSLKWNSASFELEVFGTLLLDGATIYGADLTCAHICEIQSSSIIGSAPIHVSDGSSITVNASAILGSRTDEDIVVHDLAEIIYTNNQGTGGYTDGWIRLLSQRQIQTNAANITVHQTGIGYGSSVRDDITDANGVVDIGGSEWQRIVEWVDQNGVYHSENAELTLTLSSGWGDFTTTVPAPQTPTAEINVPLPYIEVVSIDAEDTTAEVNKRIGAMVSVRNTGDAAATVNIWCYVGDNLTETTALTTTLTPGEEKELPVSWWANSDGAQVLNCRTLIPNILSSIAGDITNVEGGNSQEVGWYIGEETEDQPLIVYGILVVLIVIGTSLFARRAAQKINHGDVPEVFEEIEG